MSSHLERGFETIWSLYGTMTPVQQCMFHPDRGWLFDFAWIDRLIALEIQGGTFIRGAHSRGARQSDDYKKNNAALMMGWRVFFASTDMLAEDPLSLCDMINEMLQHPVMSKDAERSMWIARVRSLTQNGMSCQANGILVQRDRLHRYTITTGAGRFELKKSDEMAVVHFILGGKQLETSPMLPQFAV